MMPVCDDAGGVVLVLDQTDEPNDTRGDCKRSVCDADGGVEEVIDETDLPNDGLECTVDMCVGGMAVSTPVEVNSSCSSDGGSYCHPDGQCRPCPTYAECTNEASESNNTQSSAVQLGTITDDDDDGGAVCGVLDGPDDVDWYVFGGEDKVLHVVNPTRSLSANANAKLCVYARCVNSGTSVACFGESKDTAPQGQLGCCSFGKVTPTIECDGLDDSATIWIKVENSDALQCVEYELEYHF
jgi:hypothetical protein